MGSLLIVGTAWALYTYLLVEALATVSGELALATLALVVGGLVLSFAAALLALLVRHDRIAAPETEAPTTDRLGRRIVADAAARSAQVVDVTVEGDVTHMRLPARE
jgi:hypothetical protein